MKWNQKEQRWEKETTPSKHTPDRKFMGFGYYEGMEKTYFDKIVELNKELDSLKKLNGELVQYVKNYHQELIAKYSHKDREACCKVSELIAKAEKSLCPQPSSLVILGPTRSS